MKARKRKKLLMLKLRELRAFNIKCTKEITAQFKAGLLNSTINDVNFLNRQ